MTFKEAKEQAITEAIELNRTEGFHRWKTVTMDHMGNWFADECEASEMKKRDFIFMAPYGLDKTLNVKFTDIPICDWPNSLASVPN